MGQAIVTVLFSALGIAVGAGMIAWWSPSAEGASTRFWLVFAAAYLGPALLVATGGSWVVARALRFSHAGAVAVWAGLLTVAVPIGAYAVLMLRDDARAEVDRKLEASRRAHFESVVQLTELETERVGDTVMARVHLVSTEAFELRARFRVIAWGPGWSGYVESCESDQDISLSPGATQTLELRCEQDWVTPADAHTEITLWLAERIQRGSRELRAHVGSRTTRIDGLCPTP